MKARYFFTITLTITLLAISTFAIAAAQVSLETIVEKQKTIIVDGKQQVSYEPAETTVPGDILRFTLVYKNSGDEAASDVILNNPIPPNTLYQADSASGVDVGVLVFSVDGGKTYNKPAQLMDLVSLTNGSTESRVATPEKYTHIRWTIDLIPPGGTGQVSFNTLVL